MISSQTYIKLSNGNGDRQELSGPSFCGRYDGGSPVGILLSPIVCGSRNPNPGLDGLIA